MEFNGQCLRLAIGAAMFRSIESIFVRFVCAALFVLMLATLSSAQALCRDFAEINIETYV